MSSLETNRAKSETGYTDERRLHLSSHDLGRSNVEAVHNLANIPNRLKCGGEDLGLGILKDDEANRHPDPEFLQTSCPGSSGTASSQHDRSAAQSSLLCAQSPPSE
jgi:hypothetical protein